jgi:hypothetical protein
VSTLEALALYPSASAVGSDSDNIGAESDQAREETPTVAIRMAPFSMNSRRERLINFSINLVVTYSLRHSGAPPDCQQGRLEPGSRVIVWVAVLIMVVPLIIGYSAFAYRVFRNKTLGLEIGT